jgi:hypothetical protein
MIALALFAMIASRQARPQSATVLFAAGFGITDVAVSC